jgi:diguanylate cyclase (GGDEF)-like protein
MPHRDPTSPDADRSRRRMLMVIIWLGLLGTAAGWFLMAKRAPLPPALLATQSVTAAGLSILLIAIWRRWLRQRTSELCCLVYMIALCAACMVMRMYFPHYASGIQLEPLYLWFPVLYVFAFVLTDHRTGLVVALGMLLLFFVISLPFIVLDPGAPDANITLQVQVVSAAMVATLYFFSSYQYRLRQAQATMDKLAQLSSTDELTNLANRRRMAAAIGSALAGIADRRFAVMLFDVDHFKAVNDTFGHAVGDAVLVALAVRASRALRGIGALGRWGGDEFVALAYVDDAAGALRIANGLRAGVADTSLAGQPEVTISCGTTLARRGDSVDGLLQRVDAALYAAKRAGRNRVECFVDAPPATPLRAV